MGGKDRAKKQRQEKGDTELGRGGDRTKTGETDSDTEPEGEREREREAWAGGGGGESTHKNPGRSKRNSVGPALRRPKSLKSIERRRAPD